MKGRDQADNVPESTKRSCATSIDVKVHLDVSQLQVLNI